jgi:Domain of unknown function (DUF4113)
MASALEERLGLLVLASTPVDRRQSVQAEREIDMLSLKQLFPDHYRLHEELFGLLVPATFEQIYGRDTLFFAVQGVVRSWKMKQDHLSSRFTTKWREILVTF